MVNIPFLSVQSSALCQNRLLRKLSIFDGLCLVWSQLTRPTPSHIITKSERYPRGLKKHYLLRNFFSYVVVLSLNIVHLSGANKLLHHTAYKKWTKLRR